MTNLPEIQMLSVASFDQLAGQMPRTTPWFTLFLVWEQPETGIDQLVERLRPLIDNGLVYFCGWGEGSEEMHDAIDRIVSEREQSGCCLSAAVMSSSHPDESLGEALGFFREHALPTDPEVFANFSRHAVAIGSDALAHRLRQALLRQGIKG